MRGNGDKLRGLIAKRGIIEASETRDRSIDEVRALGVLKNLVEGMKMLHCEKGPHS
jgi:hypothetical protein